MDNPNASPFHALPPVVIALAVVIIGLELMFQAATFGILGGQGGVGWRLGAIRDFGMFDTVVEQMLALGVFPLEHMRRFVTYPMIHGGFIHAVFVAVFVLAIGNMVARVFSPLAFVALFVVSGVVGALGFSLFLNSDIPLIGGFPGVYGLIGAFTFMMWTEAGMRGDSQYRAFGLIAALLGIQLLFGIIDGEFGSVVAEMTGFATGFALSFVLVPGGWRRVVDKMRQRGGR